MDITFVVDSSGSIKRENWARVKNFMKNVIDDFDVGPYSTQFGAVVYGNDVVKSSPTFQLNDFDNKRELLQAIERMRFV